MVITNMGCNLNCIYCYEYQKDKVNIMNINETVEKLSPILEKTTPKGTLIKLLGGEPFMVFPQIKELCETIWARNYEEKILFHATTNGTLIHGEIKRWLDINKDRFTIKLSLDGNREAQEINRKGSFDNIDLDFFRERWEDIGIKMTISPKTIHLVADSIKFMHERGIKTIKTNFAEFVNWNDKALIKTFYGQMMELVDYYIEHPEFTPCRYLSVPLRRIATSEMEIHNCTIGHRQILDYKTGKSYPCMFFLPSVCGVKKSEEMMSIDISQKSNQVDETCNKCPFLNVCQTCYAANYMLRGATWKRDMSICAMQRITYVATAKLLVRKYVRGNTKIPKSMQGADIYKDIKAIAIVWKQLQEIEMEYEAM